ncbi:MAG: nuclear transport factor 2 family protein [Saprospiraceae bacterium]|nr:nuclear transport factor 2 family protein [Saprospiraceae bacterium]
MKKTHYLILALSTLFACQPPLSQPNKEEVFKLTKAANDASLQGHIEKNADKIIAVYTEDAVVLPPNGVKPIIGLDSIKRYYQNSLKGEGKSIEITTENLRFDVIDQNNATELGKYNIKYQASDTSAVTVFKGEMLIVWKKQNGQWKIYLDMWH